MTISDRTLTLIMNEAEEVVFDAFGWTQKQWARRAGVHPNTISRLYNGHTKWPRFETIVKILSAAKLELISADTGSVELRAKVTQYESSRQTIRSSRISPKRSRVVRAR